MKKAFLMLGMVMAGQQTWVDGPTLKLDKEYPVHVKIFKADGLDHKDAFYGNGRGNILAEDGSAMRGFQFTYSCSGRLMVTTDDLFYQARWKKQDLRLELVTMRADGKHEDHCELQMAMKGKTYER